MDASGQDTVAKVMMALVGEDADAKNATVKWKFTIYKTSWQRWAFWLMVLVLAGLAVALGIAWGWPSRGASLAAVGFLLLFQLAGLNFCMAVSLSGLWEFLRAPVRAFLMPCLGDADRGPSRVGRLARFTYRELAFVEKHLALDGAHLKARWLLALGPVEKVGMLPAVVGSVAVLYKAAAQVAPGYQSAALVLGIAAYSILLLFAFLAEVVVQRVQHYRLLLRGAMKLKDEEEKAEGKTGPEGEERLRQRVRDLTAKVKELKGAK